MNQGFTNFVGVQRESSLAGAATGDAFKLPGAIRFSWEPVLSGGKAKTSVWRKTSGDSFRERYYRGSFEIEWSANEATQMLLESLMEIVSIQEDEPSMWLTTIIFRPRRLQEIQTLRIGIEYTDGPSYTLKGVVIETFQLTLVQRGIARAKFNYKAATMEDGSTMSAGAIVLVNQQTTQLEASISLDGEEREAAAEYIASVQHPCTPARFGEGREPSRWQQDKVFGFGLEFGEHLTDEDLVSIIKGQEEVAITASLGQPGSARGLMFWWPRVVLRSGTPEALGRGGIYYRANAEGMDDPAIDPEDYAMVQLVV